jgi:hypothetical protein
VLGLVPPDVYPTVHVIPFNRLLLDENLYADIISDIAFRMNDGEVEYIEHASLEIRERIFSKLFCGKVVDADTITLAIRSSKVFLIPSVIHTSTNPFNYTARRSVFSHEERLAQTIAQVQSIPHTSVILEGSELSLRELFLLAKHAHVILYSRNAKGFGYAHTHPNKSIYEVYVLQHILPYVQADWVFKMSGRYRLRTDFSIQEFTRDKPVLKVIPPYLTYTGVPIVECVIYSIPMRYMDQYKKLYGAIEQRLLENHAGSIESLLCEYKSEFYDITSLGVIAKDGIEAMDKLP